MSNDEPDSENQNESVKKRLASIFSPLLGTRSKPVNEPIGEFKPHPVDVHIQADDVAWLVGKLDGESELHAEEIRLDTNEGTFVFKADGDTMIVTHEQEEGDNDE